ncbi:MAG: HAD family hydrolase [Planctomycetaceae bacterium]
MRTRVYLFDIDGTLLQTGGAGWRALTGAMRDEFGLQEVAGIELRGRTDYAIVGDLLRMARVPARAESRQRLLHAYHTRLGVELKTGVGSILPGVREVLESVSGQAESIVGVLTGNGPQGAEIKLRHFGLQERFTLGVFGDRRQRRTDLARDAMGMLRRRLGEDLTGGEVCIIGDTPADVECALAIDAKAVGVATGGFSRDELIAAGAHLVLNSLADWPN